MNKYFSFALIALLGFATAVQAQVKNTYAGRKTRILFLLDGSGSMVAELGSTTRWAASVTLMSQIIDTLRGVDNLEVGLRVFGHNKPITERDCQDTKLEVPFGPQNHKLFQTKLKTIRPLGYTSITQSLLAAAKDFPEDKTSRNLIIIITDGIEECNGDPCSVSMELQKKGIILQPFIIGVGSNQELFRKTYSCAGRYFNAENEEELRKAMGVIMNQALNNTTAQINLLDEQGMPRETNVPVTFYDAYTGQIVESVEHTMNGKGVPDTLYLDPIRKYRIVVHTLPQVVKENVEIVPGRHNTIAVETPMGDLALKIGGITRYGRLQAIVRESGKTATIVAQEFNTTQKFITGNYDLEILTTPRIEMKGVNIKQNRTMTIEIPAPGLLQLTTGRDMLASIFEIKENQMVWVKDIDGTRPNQDFPMQPGEYRIVYRIKSETRTIYSKTKDFKITSGANTIIAL